MIKVGTKFKHIEPALHNYKYVVCEICGERVLIDKTNSLLSTISGKDYLDKVDLSFDELIDQIGNTLMIVDE